MRHTTAGSYDPMLIFASLHSSPSPIMSEQMWFSVVVRLGLYVLKS